MVTHMGLNKRILVSIVLVVVATLAVVAGVRGQSSGGVRGSLAPPIDDPTVQTCMSRGELNCNPDPSVYATYVASNPLGNPDPANATFLGEKDALSLAGAANNSAKAQMVTYRDVARLDQGLAENGRVHPDRKVWVVTVHGNFQPTGALDTSLVPGPRVVHVYSMVIDAATGIKTDICSGCDAVK